LARFRVYRWEGASAEEKVIGRENEKLPFTAINDICPLRILYKWLDTTKYFKRTYLQIPGYVVEYALEVECALGVILLLGCIVLKESLISFPVMALKYGLQTLQK